MRLIVAFHLACLVAIPSSSTIQARSIGSDCQTDNDCDSGLCWTGLFNHLPGTCQCNLSTNGGCESPETCWDDPSISDEPPKCFDPSRLLPIGSSCSSYLDCSSLYCFQEGNPAATCECNSATNKGCEPGELCLWTPGQPGTPPICVDNPPLPIGSPCTIDAECGSSRCFYGFANVGTCQCNSGTGAGCEQGQFCDDTPTFVDGLPVCKDFLRGIGDKCKVDTDCDSIRCFRGEQLPNTLGSCQCNSETNAGCGEGQFCDDTPTYVDDLPVCVNQDPDPKTNWLSVLFASFRAFFQWMYDMMQMFLS